MSLAVDTSLSSAEAINETPVAPGQEALLEEFIAEQEAEQSGPPKILGKFNSPEELARAYQELERKLGQPKNEEPSDQSAPEPKAYSKEEGIKEYGEFLAGKFEEAELNPFEMAEAFEAGQDVEPYLKQLEGVGIPRSIVERYLQSGTAQPDSVELSDQDQAELKALVGGDEQFKELSSWVNENVPQDEIDEYNAVVASGDKAAIRWALKALQARASQVDRPALKEPELIGSGRAPGSSKVFESKAQVLEAMNKLNSKGQRLYDVDEAYRNQVVQMLDRSNVF